MGVALVAIAVGIALVIGVGGLVLFLVARIVSAIGVLLDKIGEAIVGWLGRKHLRIRAFVPDELNGTFDPLPKHDPDRAALINYSPTPNIPVRPKTVAFKSSLTRILKPPMEFSETIELQTLNDLLLVSGPAAYEHLFAVLKAGLSYPVASPNVPDNILPPPAWTPWRPTFPTPSFNAPYYEGRYRFLNEYVDYAYRKERAEVADAQRRQTEMNEVCAKRNREVEDLAERANAAFESATALQRKEHTASLTEYDENAERFTSELKREQNTFGELKLKVSASDASGLLARINLLLLTMDLPPFVPRFGESKFDSQSGILIHEHRFPDIGALQWIKRVPLKSGLPTRKPANLKERREAAFKLYPSLCLRLAAEIVALDSGGLIKAVAVNGWANYTEKATGQKRRAYCASLFATKQQLEGLNLKELDPLEAFSALKGIGARTIELTPIAPVMRLDTNDPRFVDSKEILEHMVGGQNLATMEWEDFEHLCRELFERAFAASGAEVKVTQASRDQGVDAIIFDPDPLRGGKIVVQAKRYTNTVDVSAVRDLFGTVHNEGALKGILVTTSQYGPEAYSFAKDKPLTLINGRELLGLLEQHGFKFRIDLAEARRLLRQ